MSELERFDRHVAMIRVLLADGWPLLGLLYAAWVVEGRRTKRAYHDTR